MKKILSIDGGGVRGIIPSVFLAEIERITQKPISETFDLITGTSTGGILATGLSIPDSNGKPKFSAAELVKFYTEDSKTIFKKSCFAKALTRSRYSNRDLQKALASKMGKTRFGDMTTKVMIPTYDLTDQRTYFFKSWKPSCLQVPAYKIATAGSSAPTYFDPTPITLSKGVEERYFIDGAVVANNPAMCAYSEAKVLWGDEDVYILSLGSGDITDPINIDDGKKWGAISWLPNITEVFMGASTNTAHYQLSTIQPDLYDRFQIKLEGNTKLDNVSPNNISYLYGQAKDMVVQNKDRIEQITDFISSR
jgi:patatin-like phospholipase/acyl hydrolase